MDQETLNNFKNFVNKIAQKWLLCGGEDEHNYHKISPQYNT